MAESRAELEINNFKDSYPNDDKRIRSQATIIIINVIILDNYIPS